MRRLKDLSGRQFLRLHVERLRSRRVFRFALARAFLHSRMVCFPFVNVRNGKTQSSSKPLLAWFGSEGRFCILRADHRRRSAGDAPVLAHRHLAPASVARFRTGCLSERALGLNRPNTRAMLALTPRSFAVWRLAFKYHTPGRLGRIFLIPFM